MEFLSKRLYDPPPYYVSVDLNAELSKFAWDDRFIIDVTQHTLIGSALSTAQGELAIKILRKKIFEFPEHLQTQVSDLLDTPVYRKAPRVSVEIPRQVRWVGGSYLVFRCKYNPNIINEIKGLKTNRPFHNSVNYIHDRKLWMVEVSSFNVDKVIDIIGRFNFQCDDVVYQVLADASSGKGKPVDFSADEEKITVTVNDDPFWCKYFGIMGWLDVRQV